MQIQNIFSRTRLLSTRLNRLSPIVEKIDHLAEPVFLFALVAWVLIFSYFRISGTSIGVYYRQFYGSEHTDPALIFGQPRNTRGDEFRVATSWTAAQAQRDFPVYNDLFGVSGQTLFFYDVPVKDFTLLFKPHLWMFLVLPLENAFAYKWWFRGALLIFALYLLFRRFTRRRVLLSIGAVLALFFTPFLQWWYSINFIDIITYYLLLFEIFLRMLEYRRTMELFLYAVLFAYCTIAVIFFFYPPPLISVGWLMVILAGGYTWYRRELLTRERMINYLRAGTVSLVLIGGFGLAFYLQYRTVLNLITKTIYPGQRTATTIGVPLLTLLSGFFDIQLLQNLIVIPEIFPSNPSEASSFFFFGIFLLPVMPFLIAWDIRRTRKVPFWTVLITLTFLIFLLWILYPPPLAVASLLMMSKVPALRMLLALGAINNILVFWYLFGVSIPTHKAFHWICAGLALALFLFYLGFGYYLKDNYIGFIALPGKIVAIALFTGLAFYFLLQKKAALFVTLLLIFSFLSSYSVNPLYQGLGELTHGKLATMIQEVNKRDGGKSRWVMYDSTVINILQANGAKGVSGVFYYPDFAMYHVFDPQGQFAEVYNRYAHTVYIVEYNKAPLFRVISNDAFALFINPCNESYRALNVKYQILPIQSNASCLKEVDQVKYPEVKYYIYEYK